MMKHFYFLFSLLLLSSALVAQWSTNSAANTVVTNTAGCLDENFENIKSAIVTDAAGNFFVAWSDDRTGTPQTYVQKFNANGEAQWTANGIRVASTTSAQLHVQVAIDGNGGCTVVWTDSSVIATSYDIRVQRLNSIGTTQWTAGGVVICNAVNRQLLPRIIQDGAGGNFISWYDERAVAGTGAMYFQRINSGGTAQLTANGVLVNGSVIDFFEQHTLMQDNTNAVIVWGQANSNYDIRAQKYNAAGAAQWGVQGTAVVATANDEQYFQTAIDNAGNVFVTWESYAPPNFDVSDAFIQKINSAGAVQWGAGGAVVSTAVDDQYWPAVAPDNAGGAFVAWQDYSVNTFASDIYIQKFNSSGIAGFAANGIVICNAADDQEIPEIVADGAGGAVVSFIDYRSTTYDIYAQRFNSSGAGMWVANGVTVANAANTQAAQEMVVSNSGVVMSFYDDRGGVSCFDSYIQRINFDGTLGNWPTAVTDLMPQKDNIKVYPTLMHAVLIVENNNPFAVDMRLMDLNGKVVMQQKIGAGVKMNTNVSRLSPGVYISDYLLKDGKRVKLPLMKQ
jgi:hypothetical protein